MKMIFLSSRVCAFRVQGKDRGAQEHYYQNSIAILLVMEGASHTLDLIFLKMSYMSVMHREITPIGGDSECSSCIHTDGPEGFEMISDLMIELSTRSTSQSGVFSQVGNVYMQQPEG